jgi:YfiH family protein
MTIPSEWLVPGWPAPRNVRAFVTTRAGGVSEGEYASLNLGFKGGDDPARVERNRAIVRAHLPAVPSWITQVHGADVADLDAPHGEAPKADGAVTREAGRVAVVATADCMPLLLCDAAGTRVGVAHAGWRGMSAGVIEQAVRALGVPPRDVMAWMGPTIGPAAFEVGPEVRAAFVAADARAEAAFVAHRPGKFLADLYALARQRLAAAGVREVHGGGWCTYTQADRFFSYRRVQQSGRMGAFIWRE